MPHEINIGRKVQEFRIKSGISLRTLASQSGLSPSMLSQIENNTANPSINTLKNIADALNVPLFNFFKEDNPENKLILRNGDNMVIGHANEEVLYTLLTPDTSGTIEFCRMDIPAGTASSDKSREHTGEEVAYVISGEIDLYLNDSVYHLLAGDSVRIPPLTKHRWENNYSGDFTAVFAITPPSF